MPRLRTRVLFAALQGAVRLFALALFLLAALPAAGQQLDLPSSGDGGGGSAAPAESETDAYNSAWFEAEELNSGLPPPGRMINRITPRSTVSEFLILGDAGAFDHAAHLLDLTLIPPDDQARLGPILAEQLHEVIMRKVRVDWESLPEREDAVETVASQSDARAGEPRKSIRIALLDLEPRPMSIRINRIKSGDSQPVWVFSAQTVANIPHLYEAFGPTSIERKLPSWLKAKLIGRYGWWEVLMTPAILGISCLFAWATYRLIHRLNRPLRARWLRTAIQSSRAPAALIVALTFFYSATRYLGLFSGPVYSTVQPILVALLIGSFTWLSLRFVDTILDFATNRYVGELGREENSDSRHLYTNISVLRRVVLLIAVLAAAGLLFEELNAFESLGGALLASAGIITIVFGFAAQTVLGNILSSLQIAIAKPIRIGDTVLYEGQWGFVEEINYTYVLIRVWNERRLVVPVRYFVSHPFENWSIRDTRVTMPIELTLDHRTDVQAMREKFAELLKADERQDPSQPPKTLVVSQNENGMVLRFYATAKDSLEAWYLHCDLREKLLVCARELEDERYLPHTRLAVKANTAAE